ATPWARNAGERHGHNFTPITQGAIMTTAAGTQPKPPVWARAWARAWAWVWGGRPAGKVVGESAKGFLKLLFVLLVLGIIFAIFFFTVRYGKDRVNTKSATTSAYLFAFEALVVVGIVVSLACRTTTPRGLQFLYTGDDQRTSTSKIQYLIWT